MSEGFLSRWSRRKREVPEAEAAPETVAASPPSPPVQAACPVPGMEEVDLASLPPIEDLTVTSDLGPFLRPGIPAALRAAALRRMWSVDPAIRDFIGCVDYQWDFNTPGGLPAGFASELVGDVQKLLAQAIGQREEKFEEDVTAPEVVEPAPLTPLRLDDPAEPPPALIVRTEEPAALPASDEKAPPPPRRHGRALPV